MDCSPLGSSVHGILQARTLEWIAMPSSRGSSWPRERTHVSYVSAFAGVLYHWAIREETTFPLSTIYLLISSTLEYTESGFRIADPYNSEEQTY